MILDLPLGPYPMDSKGEFSARGEVQPTVVSPMEL